MKLSDLEISRRLNPTCDRCARPATSWRRNVRERAPVGDEDPRWTYYSQDGIELGCDEHPV